MKILCVLYDDPKGGMPKSYPLKDLPKLEKYPDGMTLPSPKGRDFNPGELLGCVSGELGLRKFLESNGHELVVTNSKGKGNHHWMLTCTNIARLYHGRRRLLMTSMM